MSRDRLEGRLFLTDGGLETTLVFHEGLDLPYFAAFDLLRRPGGRETLERYYRPYGELARRRGAGLILESATWRASADWGALLGYSREELATANRRAIELLVGLREELGAPKTPVVLSGCVGPRGDGYVPSRTMSAAAAEEYHREQVETFASTAADMVCATTMNTVEEAVGVTRAARAAGLPIAVSFTLEVDGRLPTGLSLEGAIEEVDAATDGAPAYYMINCAHPTHFEHVMRRGGRWTERVRGLRANASSRSHAELDEATDLDAGDPRELGRQYAALRELLPRLDVLGGCCGTDHRHVEEIAHACIASAPATVRHHAEGDHPEAGPVPSFRAAPPPGVAATLLE
jgi:S-methylmethionine-dependent homocysteine/selenocysteine methylase